MKVCQGQTPPILADKHHDAPSAFSPESLLRDARRQKGADAVAVPQICLLDRDGDIVRQFRAERRARRHEGWVCCHTGMWVFDLDGHEIGVVGCAVDAASAVLGMLAFAGPGAAQGMWGAEFMTPQEQSAFSTRFKRARNDAERQRIHREHRAPVERRAQASGLPAQTWRGPGRVQGPGAAQGPGPGGRAWTVDGAGARGG
jgi:hypothetical protein